MARASCPARLAPAPARELSHAHAAVEESDARRREFSLATCAAHEISSAVRRERKPLDERCALSFAQIRASFKSDGDARRCADRPFSSGEERSVQLRERERSRHARRARTLRVSSRAKAQRIVRMSLRAKIVVILLAVVLLYAAVDRAIQEVVIAKSFATLESEEAGLDLKRVVQAIESEVRHLSVRCDDWATWDDTYRFIDDARRAVEEQSGADRTRFDERATSYIVSNLVPECFHKNNLNLLYLCDAHGKVVWGRSLTLVDDHDIDLHDFPSDRLPAGHRLLFATNGQKSETERACGLMMTERGPLLVSAKPILDSHRHGPARGTVIMGRLLSVGLVDALVKQTGVAFRIWRVKEEELPDEEKAISAEIAMQPGRDARVIRAVDDDTLHAYTTFYDIGGSPALLIRADIARDITARGAVATHYALASTLVAGALLLLVLLVLLQRTVIHPIRTLTKYAVDVGRNEDLTMKLGLDRADEIGILSREFEALMEKLAESRRALVKAARAAGMSEIATGVLHNVGNVLNSVNVSVTMVADKAKSAGLRDLKLALQAVQDSSGDLETFLASDPRGAHLYPLLHTLAGELEREHEVIAREAASVSEGIEHIKALIQSQQSRAGRAGVLEVLTLKDEIEAALRLVGDSIDGRPIEIAREYDDMPPFAADRHRLKEILVNLIQNARQAMQPERAGDREAARATGGDAPKSSAARSSPRLTLRLKSSADGRVHIEVEDNGVGIPRENLSRIFTHGFTTKASGHGFGLHASANAATEMGATLSARSDGPGTGATFHLDLPAERKHAVGADA
jgi:signal transduction histidine kinase